MPMDVVCSAVVVLVALPAVQSSHTVASKRNFMIDELEEAHVCYSRAEKGMKIELRLHMVEYGRAA
jgi:hypothetical protein